MNTIDRNPLGIENPQVRALSEIIFKLYHTNPGDKSHSRVSDQLALNLAVEENVMELVNAIARVHCPQLPGEVIGFLIKQPSILETIMESLRTPPITEQELVDPHLGVNPFVLWAKVAKSLAGEDYGEVQFQTDYIEVADGIHRPAIRGEGITINEVNGAMLKVLDEHNAMEHLDGIPDWMANDIDEDGWVFSTSAPNYDA